MTTPSKPAKKDYGALFVIRISRTLKKYNPYRMLAAIAARRKAIVKIDFSNTRRAIIFLLPGYDVVTGGIMSCISIANETRAFHAIHGADVFTCTTPGTPPLFRYSGFENTESLFNLDQLIGKLTQCEHLLLHVPEIYVGLTLKWLNTKHFDGNVKIQTNILLQNIDYCPTSEQIAELSKFGKVTCTTSHLASIMHERVMHIACPIHHLSTYVTPKRYKRIDFSGKQEIIVYSPDAYPEKRSLLLHIHHELPSFQFIQIINMSYMAYKENIQNAMFTITFGEGLDGYFVEAIFTGGIGIAVYNDRFFTKTLQQLPFVYQSYEELKKQLGPDIRKCLSERTYTEIQEMQFAELEKLYPHADYELNIRYFYEKFFNVHETA